MWAALLLLPLLFAAGVAPTAGRAAFLAPVSPAQESGEPGQSRKGGSEFAETGGLELEALYRRPQTLRLRAPRTSNRRQTGQSVSLSNARTPLAFHHHNANPASLHVVRPIPILLHKQSFLN